jgi:tetratricopeptide (TPR) repeat protein
MPNDSIARNHAAAEKFNAAHDHIRQGDREAAAMDYQQAFDLLEENTVANCAFKAFIAYQHGVCLLKHHQLEGKTPTQIFASQHSVAELIKQKWNETVRLYNMLKDVDVQRFEDQFHLASIIQAIMRDPLMEEDTLQQLFAYGLQCAKEKNKTEAANVLAHVVKKLESDYPDHREMIATAHLRLAALTSDLGDIGTAAVHARWVLKNAPPQNEMSRMAMQIILEESGRR